MNVSVFKTAKNLLLKNTLAYVVIACLTPLLTRVYEPGQFGTLSLMVFFGSFLSVLFTARLELAIPLIKEPFLLNNLIQMLLFSTFICSFMTCIIVYVFEDHIFEIFFSQGNFGNWLLIVPFYGLALSIHGILTSLLIKQTQFHEMGLSLLLQNGAFCFVAIALSSFSDNFNGLIAGKFAGLLAVIIFVVIILEYKLHELFFLRPEFRLFKKNIKNLKQFIQFNFPTSIIGIIGKDLMIIIFAYSQDVTYAGFYAIARAVGELPISIISSSLGPIFYSKAARSFNDVTLKNKVLDEFILIFKLLFTLLIPTYLILSIWAVEIFKFLFGDSWEISGIIFLYLLPISVISIFSCWLNRLFEVLGRQKIAFKIQVIFEGSGFAFSLALIYFGFQFEIILASVVTCFSFVPIFITLYAFRWLSLQMKAIRLIVLVFFSFSFLNAIIISVFSNDLGQNIQTIWLLISAMAFHLLGIILFKKYRLRDINVFS